MVVSAFRSHEVGNPSECWLAVRVLRTAELAANPTLDFVPLILRPPKLLQSPQRRLLHTTQKEQSSPRMAHAEELPAISAPVPPLGTAVPSMAGAETPMLIVELAVSRCSALATVWLAP
jgi:hypothetical protein